MKLHPRKVVPAGLCLLFLVALFTCPGSAVFAQTTEPKPVARLITDSVDKPMARRLVEPTSRAITPTATFPSLKDATEIERRAFEQTNLVRKEHGLSPFMWDPQLCRLAREHSANMARLRFFSHATPEGLRLQDRARSAGIRYAVIAENIAYNMGYDDPGAFAVERWMVSPGHRANILYAGFQSMAVGTFVAADGSVYLTQTFITR